MLAAAVERAQVSTLPFCAGAGRLVVGHEDIPRAALREVVHPFVVEAVGDRRVFPTLAKRRDIDRRQVTQPQQVILIIEIRIQRIVDQLRLGGLKRFDLTVVEVAQCAEVLLAVVAQFVGTRRGCQQCDENGKRSRAQPREGATHSDHQGLVLRRVAADAHREHVGR